MKPFSKATKYGEKLFPKQHHPVVLHLMLILAALDWFNSLFVSVLLYSSTPVFCVQTFVFHCLLRLGPVLIHRNHLFRDKTLTFWPLSLNASPTKQLAVNKKSSKASSLRHGRYSALLPRDFTFSSIQEITPRLYLRRISLFLEVV